MGHLINPITYRVGKTKFWKGVWSHKTKKNYKNLLIEDLNFYKFFKWLVSVLNWDKLGISLNDFILIKNINNLNICFYFFKKKLNLNFNIKNLFFKFSIKSFFIKIYFLKFFNKNFLKIKNIFNKNLNSINNRFCNKKNYFFYKKKKILKFFLKTYNTKKKKRRRIRSWFLNFLFKYCFFLMKKKYKNINNLYLNSNSFFFNKLFKKKNLILFFKKQKSLFFLQKNIMLKNFNFNFFFRLLNYFLTFFLKNIFQHQNFIFNFFQKNNYFLNANALKNIIQFGITGNRVKIANLVRKIFKKTRKKKIILGLKIGFFGRYEKKLRNKNVWHIRGSLSPSNINSVLSYKSFSILLKQGLCGLKISFLNKMNKNEIFKKKTFINKTFKF